MKSEKLVTKPHDKVIAGDREANKLFTKENYKWMLIGLVFIALGFILMAGGKSDNPGIFNNGDIYSPMRITVAPILIVGGLVIEIFAIMKMPK